MGSGSEINETMIIIRVGDLLEALMSMRRERSSRIKQLLEEKGILLTFKSYMKIQFICLLISFSQMLSKDLVNTSI